MLIFPAALFMAALFLRYVQPQAFEPVHTGQRIVDWYAARTHLGLWLFLMALPLAELVTCCMSLVRGWRSDAALRNAVLQCGSILRRHLPVLIVALATVLSAAILRIVAIHLIAG